MFNHHPAQQGIWFPYNDFRYKDYYDIKLKSGDIVKCCYPNGSGWYPINDDSVGRIDDTDVAEVMLVPDSDLPKYAYTGDSRIKNSIELFDNLIPQELLEQFA